MDSTSEWAPLREPMNYRPTSRTQHRIESRSFNVGLYFLGASEHAEKKPRFRANCSTCSNASPGNLKPRLYTNFRLFIKCGLRFSAAPPQGKWQHHRPLVREMTSDLRSSTGADLRNVRFALKSTPGRVTYREAFVNNTTPALYLPPHQPPQRRCRE